MGITYAILDAGLMIRDAKSFKSADSASYDTFAADYHECISALSAPFAEKMVSLSEARPGERVLDVGTGTGVVANHAASIVGPEGRVVGVDLSEEMLCAARSEAGKLGLGNVEFRKMDAEHLDVPDGSFDHVYSLCAILHFPDASRALAEMNRILRPGGRLVVSLGQGMPPWGGGRLRALQVGIRREVGRLVRPNIYAPGFMLRLVADRLGNIPSPEHSDWGGRNPARSLKRLVEGAGFSIESICWEENSIPVEDVERFWRYQVAVITEARKRLQQAGAGVTERFRDEFLNRARAAVQKGGKLFYCGAVFMINARRP